MNFQPMSVALPWSLSHYIALNGFHPLYRALIDEAPTGVEFHAWDNIKLHNRFERDIQIRKAVLEEVINENRRLQEFSIGSVAREYGAYFWPPNQILSNELLGDIEFHHTAPFPSLKRPFVFHCESFSPIFTPFVGQGEGKFSNHEQLRDYYRRIFTNPLCLGIFSHIPNTVESISLFFSDANIDKKLFSSRIGVSSYAFRGVKIPAEKKLSNPKFLFINSAHQNPQNFFNRGGHIVLRFWEKFTLSGRDGQLILRCIKPSNEDFVDYGVNTSFLDAETGKSILWAEDYLANYELNTLMANVHFFLLPSVSLHSVSIMQAMTLGLIPVITDTVGTSVYLTDKEHGIVLKGVKEALWKIDPDIGVLVDHYQRRPKLDDSLVSQMTSRIFAMLDAPDSYVKMRKRILAQAKKQFSGQAFSEDFWSSVTNIYQKNNQNRSHATYLPGDMCHSLQDCTLNGGDWSRVLESVPQPMKRIFTGRSLVWELGGAFLQAFATTKLKLTDWSVFAQYFSQDAPKMSYGINIGQLGGKYLSLRKEQRNESSWLIGFVLKVLMPFPKLHGCVKSYLNKLSSYRDSLRSSILFFIFSLNPSGKEPDVELILHGVSGYNIVRFFHKYYAIPQHEGEFNLEKLKSRGYSSSFSDKSVDSLLWKISKALDKGEQMEKNEDVGQEDLPYLADEGFNGYNIIFLHAKYFAILQNEGTFDYEKILSDQYDHFFSGHSIEEVKRLILSGLEKGNN